MPPEVGWALPDTQLLLASASMARQQMLANAGLHFAAQPAHIDEDAVRQGAGAEGLPLPEIAILLAELKAEAISARHPDALVIGCDQLLICEGEMFAKPADRTAAARQLARLSGRHHELATAVVLLRQGQRLWQHLARPQLTMRALDPQLIEAYLDQIGDAALDSPGCYQIEGPGAQLMQKISGDWFSILGLPLLELLAQLREYGLAPQVQQAV